MKAVGPYGVTVARGHLIEPSVDDLFVAARASAEFVIFVDYRLSQKFKLKTTIRSDAK